ncbi:hypothetical protein V6N11_027392 [Hibiscus sabdariffa]|uniref:RNase H type-1 domain-containing protein n=1 Tax=Hibiscus sabdariffa TaxID=183260 RepID=A0ABR2PH82_9ROSI
MPQELTIMVPLRGHVSFHLFSEHSDSIGGVLRDSSGDWIRGYIKSMILELLPASCSSSLVRSISSLRNCPWELSFLWIPQEQNMIVDCLSKLSLSPDSQLRIYDDVLKLIQPLLIQDRNSPLYHRCRRVS